MSMREVDEGKRSGRRNNYILCWKYINKIFKKKVFLKQVKDT